MTSVLTQNRGMRKRSGFADNSSEGQSRAERSRLHKYSHRLLASSPSTSPSTATPFFRRVPVVAYKWALLVGRRASALASTKNTVTNQSSNVPFPWPDVLSERCANRRCICIQGRKWQNRFVIALARLRVFPRNSPLGTDQPPLDAGVTGDESLDQCYEMHQSVRPNPK